jgi:hypothetical protein
VASQISTVDLASVSANIGVITAGRIQNAGETQGVLISGTLPGGWTRYLNLNGSGIFLKHDKLELNYDGTAVFYGVARDPNTKFEIDFPNKLLTIVDEQSSAQTRVELGKLGTGSDYGLQIYGYLGTTLFRIADDELPKVYSIDIGPVAEDGFSSAGRISISLAAGASGNPQLKMYTNATFTAGLLEASGTTQGTSLLELSGYVSAAKTLKLRDASIKIDDGSTNEGDVACVVVSSSAASGDYPEGTIWCQY